MSVPLIPARTVNNKGKVVLKDFCLSEQTATKIRAENETIKSNRKIVMDLTLNETP